MKLLWYKVKTRWASGLGDWKIEYVVVADDQDLTFIEEDIAYEINSRWDYSDKYRGCDFEWIDSKDIPAERFKEEMENIDKRIIGLQRTKELLFQQAI